MSKILYEVYKNNIRTPESVMYGKYYARLKSIETMSVARMAKSTSASTARCLPRTSSWRV